MSIYFTGDTCDYIATASGDYTTKFISVFDTYSTNMFIERYRIKLTAWSGTFPHYEAGYEDYNAATSGSIKVLMDTDKFSENGTRSTWTSANSVSYATMVTENQEQRTFFLSPNTSSGWINLNQVAGSTHPELWGRDVIVITHFNKFYHIQTIQPKFIANQIAYYEVTAQPISEWYYPFENSYDAYGVMNYQVVTVT